MSTQASPPPMVQAANVSKWFGDLVAVSDVSFSIGAGVTALLGPNGAGKSTLLRMMCGLARPSNGTVTVLGKNPRADVAVLGRMLAPQQESLLDYLSGRGFVDGRSTAHSATRRKPQATAVESILKTTEALSLKGMRQRSSCPGIVHDPLVIALDEPLTGLARAAGDDPPSTLLGDEASV